jgi:murein DD-endopeptidase MepM/ murein hydrolase activator NlpD
MATIDSKKLLPPSKKTGAIEKTKVLVPLKNISVKKISAGDLRPVDKETKSSENLSIVKKKIIELGALLKNSYVIDKKNAETKRKEEERKKSERREKKLEEKVKKNQVSSNLIPSIPGQSIFDRINRFIGFTLLGYLFNKYGELLPKLMEFGKVLKPVAEFVESFAKNLLKGVVDFVEFGYKAYDQSRDFVKQIGGEGAEKTFDEFSKNFNLMLNGAIGASMLIASTAPKKPKIPLGKEGGGYGAGYSAGYAAGLASRGKGPRYRGAGQSAAGRTFGENLQRQALTKERMLAPTGPKGPLDRIGRGFKGAAAQLETGTLFKRGAGIQKGLYNAPGKIKGLTGKIKGVMPKGVGKVFGRIPIIGGLIDFAFSLAMGEKPGRAAAKAVGSTVGSALGTLIPIPFAGTILGGILGDIVGGALYDTLVGDKKKPVQGRSEGGTVTGRGQSRVAKSRRIKTTTKKTAPRIQPQKTQPGKDAGGKLRIEKLYGTDEPGKRSALRALKKSSEDVKKMRSVNGLAGSMFGAGIDMALGQKPDKKLAKSIGDVFGSVVQNAVDMELNKSFGDISKTIAMAGGGAVPTREIGRSLGIGERIGKFISTALAISIESSASKILQNLNRELNLEGGPAGSIPDAGPGGGPLTQDQQEAFEKIKKIAERLGSPNPSVTAAIAMHESGYLTSVLAKQNNNPFGQTDGRGGFQIYRSFDEAVEYHINRWKSSYIGKTPQEIIESIRLGKGKGAPGAYNVEDPNWSQKVLRAYQSGTQPQPSSTPTKGAAAAVLPRGNPVFTSGFGSRWGKQHRGIDIGVDANSPVTALQDGKVTDIYKSFGGHGDGVVVTHSDGTKIVYGHVNSKVRKGENIKKGQTIATVKGWYNAYGNKDNTHLHLERYVSGAATDPTGYLNSLVPKPVQASAPKPDTRPASPPPPGGPRQKLTRKNQWTLLNLV